ncbi:MAG: GAF domain-containing protein [Acidobacteria bacterium]|nr:GAF domain-containing protein [Acidobacteriota bacterium]
MASSTLPFNQLAEQCQAAGLNAENAARIASELSRSFGVHDDEVAIFKLEQAQLRFIYPPSLSNVGMIPLNHSTSVAARTANTKRPEAINNFPQMRHASIFEAVPVDSRTRSQKPDQKPEKIAMPIQKMMSVPVIGPAGVLGVIQLSRKGSTPHAAGPDFQHTDLQRLTAAANVLAKCFK